MTGWSAPASPTGSATGCRRSIRSSCPSSSRRSLGTYAIIWLVERARRRGLPYVYLGYWVPESRKMAYKARFRPAEILVAGLWRPLAEESLVGAAEGDLALVSEPTG